MEISFLSESLGRLIVPDNREDGGRKAANELSLPRMFEKAATMLVGPMQLFIKIRIYDQRTMLDVVKALRVMDSNGPASQILLFRFVIFMK